MSRLASATLNPSTQWLMQIARSLRNPFDEFIQGQRFIIIDRDSKYCDAFHALLQDAGVKPLRLPPRSPNLIAWAERFVRSIKVECLGKMIFFGERSGECRSRISIRIGENCFLRHDLDADRIFEPHAVVGMWYLELESPLRKAPPVSVRKPVPIPLTEFVPWTAAHFKTEEIRDRFLHDAATLPARDVEIEPMLDEVRGALVRWRPGQFLRLNDIAYAHGGRIVTAGGGRLGRLN